MLELSESLTIAEARPKYFSASGFFDDVYSEKFSTYPLGPVKLKLPNTGQIPFHDIHHILTGYDTSYEGEFQTAAWELGSGGSSKLGPWFFMLVGLFWGTLLYPSKTFKAFIRGRRSKNLLKKTELAYTEFDQITVGDLRKKLSISVENEKIKPRFFDTAFFSLFFGYMLISNLAFLGLVVWILVRIFG